ncbi:MAG: HNH endonuclease [Brasilonema sp.]
MAQSWSLRPQKGKCAECGLHLHPDDQIEIHHLDGNYKNRRKENLIAAHRHCHDQIHGGNGNLSTQLSTHNKGQFGEKPDERKLSRPVLKPSRVGDYPAMVNGIPQILLMKEVDRNKWVALSKY